MCHCTQEDEGILWPRASHIPQFVLNVEVSSEYSQEGGVTKKKKKLGHTGQTSKAMTKPGEGHFWCLERARQAVLRRDQLSQTRQAGCAGRCGRHMQRPCGSQVPNLFLNTHKYPRSRPVNIET